MNCSHCMANFTTLFSHFLLRKMVRDCIANFTVLFSYFSFLSPHVFLLHKLIHECIAIIFSPSSSGLTWAAPVLRSMRWIVPLLPVVSTCLDASSRDQCARTTMMSPSPAVRTTDIARTISQPCKNWSSIYMMVEKSLAIFAIKISPAGYRSCRVFRASTQKKEGDDFKHLSTSKHFLHSFDHIKEKLARKGGWPIHLCCFS